MQFRAVGERQSHGVVRDQEIEGISFFQFQIQFEFETQFCRRFRKSTGRDVIIENVAPEAHSRAFVRPELAPVEAGKDITPGKKPNLVPREADRLGVLVGSFVAHAEFLAGRLEPA